MKNRFPASLRFLTTEEGGRRTALADSGPGSIHFVILHARDGAQNFELGEFREADVEIMFFDAYADELARDLEFRPGGAIELSEGERLVARGLWR